MSSVRDGDSEVLRTAQKAAVAKLERILSAQTASAEGMRIAKKTAGVSTVQSAKRDGGGGFLVWRAGSKSRTAFDGEVCNPMAQVVVSKVVEPQLVVLDPIPGTLTSEISADPQMPSATLRAQLRNFNKGSVEYHWTFYTKWVGPDGREFFDPFDGTSSAQNSDPATWEVNWDGRIRGGNDLSVRVVAIADGVSYEARIENLGTIKGVNPSVAEIKAGLNLEEQVVVYMESKPKWTQFTASGYPSWGKPHGYGLMQLDNPRSTDEQVWNWRANKQAGTAVYSQKRRIALAHPRKVREQTLLPKTHKNYRPAGYRSATDFSSEELLKDAFQLYNGGYFWDWKPEDPSNPNSDGTWGVVAKPLKGHSLPHGAEAWNVYKQVQDATNGIGTYPDKWNDR